MTTVSLWIIDLIIIIIVTYLFPQYVLSEEQIYKIKYTFYVTFTMLLAIIVLLMLFIQLCDIINIRLASRIVNSMVILFSIKYRVENAQILEYHCF